MSDELHDLSGDLVVYAARLVRAVRRLSDSPGGAMRVVSLLDEHGPLGVTELARIDRSSQPSMTGAVNSLVQRGWVEKTPDPHDARASLITMTPDGRAELTRVRLVNADAVATRLAELPDHDIAELTTAVALLRDLLTHPSKGNL